MILTAFCARPPNRLASARELLDGFARRRVLHRYFGANVIQCFRRNSRGQFINHGFAVGQFRFENLAAHCLPGDFKEFLDWNNLRFLVELSPKKLQRIR